MKKTDHLPSQGDVFLDQVLKSAGDGTLGLMGDDLRAMGIGMRDVKSWLPEALTRPTSGLSAAAVLGSACVVALLDVDAIAPVRLRRVLARASQLSLVVSDARAEEVWIAAEVGTGALGPDPVSDDRLHRAMKILYDVLAPESDLGVVVSVGSGRLSSIGPLGRAWDEARQLFASGCRPGVMLATEDLAQRLRRMGWSMFKGLRPFVEPDDRLPPPAAWCFGIARWEQPDAASGARVLLTGTQTVSAFSFTADVVASAMDAGSRPRGRYQLRDRDRIQLELSSPEDAFVYVLSVSEGRLAWELPARPVRVPGDPSRVSYELKLGRGSGRKLRPAMLAVPVRVGDLEALFGRVNDSLPSDATSEEVLVALSEAWAQLHPGEWLAIATSPEFEYEAHQSNPALDRANELHARGQLAEAVRAYRELLPDLPTVEEKVHVLQLLARDLRQLDQVGPALLTIEEAMALSQNTALTAPLKREKARLMAAMGDARGALAVCEEALIELRHLGDVENEAWTENARAGILWSLNEWDEALKAYRRVVELSPSMERERLWAAGHHGQGMVLWELGQAEAAQEELEKAAALYESTGQRLAAARVLGDLSLAHLSLGRPQQALHLASRQVDLISGASVDAQIKAGRNYAVFAIVLGRLEAAASMLDRLEELLPAAPESTLHAFYYTRALLLEAQGEPLKALDYVALAEGRGSGGLFDVAWRFPFLKARLLNATGGAGADEVFAQAIDQVELHGERVSREARVRLGDQVADLWLAYVESGVAAHLPPVGLAARVEGARARAMSDALAAEVDREQGGVDSLTRRWVRERQVDDKNLESLGCPVLSFFCLRRQLLVLGFHQGELTPFFVGMGAKALHAEVELLRSLWDKGQDRCAADHWIQLSQALFSPLQDWLDQLPVSTPLALLPHGPLARLPLHGAALRGGTRALLQVAEPFYAPSLEALVRRGAPREAQVKTAAILSSPSGSGLGVGEGLARELARRLGSTPLVGEEATLANYLARSADVDLLHLFAHGHRSEGAREAFIELGRQGADRIGRPFSLLKGVVDGAMTTRVVLEQHLRAELVVLAACLSGDGRLTAGGEGVDLLPWAFLRQGARSVVSCPFEVAPAVAVRVLTGLYEELAAGRSRCAALAAAVRPLVGRPGEGPDWERIKDWGGFCLSGDWQTIRLPSLPS